MPCADIIAGKHSRTPECDRARGNYLGWPALSVDVADLKFPKVSQSGRKSRCSESHNKRRTAQSLGGNRTSADSPNAQAL